MMHTPKLQARPVQIIVIYKPPAALLAGKSTPPSSNLLPPIDKADADPFLAKIRGANLKQKMIDLIVEISTNGSGDTILATILDIVDTQARRSGVWGQTSNCAPPGTYDPTHFVLGAQLVTANPLAELSFWGYANLSTGYDLFETIFDYSSTSLAENAYLQVPTATFSRAKIQNVKFHWTSFARKQLQIKVWMARYYGSYVSTIFSTFAAIFLTIGYSLAFVLPLFPFFRFFFAVLTWIVSVLEGVAAVPLIALGHLNPEGEGLPGGTAKAAYFMVFNIFLRPVMTIFGLIAGLLVFYIAIIFLNATYAIAIAGTTGMYHFGEATLIRIAYTFIYGATAYTCANTCFKTIDMFPEQALRWISANAHSEKMGDDLQNVKGAWDT